MIAGLDSSFFRPSVAQLQQAKAVGVRIWGGYLTTKPNVGIASPWDQASFERVRTALGTTPIAWASGWDDPVACRRKAAAWNVRLGLDDESGIRVGLSPLEEEHVKRRIANRGPRRLDGSWVQPWLDASGAGLYGNASVFNGRRAPFFVIAAYPASGNPGRIWPAGAALPQVPCGWQWQGTHDEFGGGVDRGWYDDWFLGGSDDMPQSDEILRLLLFGNAPDYANPSGNAYGWSTPGGTGHLTRVADVLLANQAAILSQLGVEKAEIDAMLAAVKAPPVVDVEALASRIVAKLPTGTATLDASSASTLAKAVVDEIGARVKPA